MAFHGYVRLTMDVDILLLPSKTNARRVMQALAESGFGEAGIPASAFCHSGAAVSLGAQPNQVGLLAGMKQRGIMLPTDEQYLETLRPKAGAGE